MTRYVAGFLFATLDNLVLLVQKARPAWQAGKWNAIGGHIEEGETPYEAMVREFHEETGCLIEDWTHAVTLRGEGFEVLFFSARIPRRCTVQGAPDEPVQWHHLDYMDRNASALMYNLRWLLPVCEQPGPEWPVLVWEKGATL